MRPQIDREVTREEDPQQRQVELVKLAVDVHADSIVVARQVEGLAPQPPQRMDPEGFLRFAAKQKRMARRVVSCYEAGLFGYVLHRKLVDMGIDNLVIRPQDWDERHRGVKSDARDSSAMLSRLGRWLAGDKEALVPVHVPDLAQEMARAESRLRERMRRTRQRLEAQGRTMMVEFGRRYRGHWWSARRWAGVSAGVEPALGALLVEIRETIVEIDRRVSQMDARIEKADTTASQIKGLGRLTNQIIEREVQDWNAFANRRAIGSITGLCPRVWASGQSRREGSISKCGRPLLRHALTEAAWRMVRFQRDYPPVKHRLRVLLAGSNQAKKKAVVAIARRLAVDLWRIRTGRAEAAQLGLKPMLSGAGT